jgi:8-oxo-dGTP pyrophosphatase MutT (NUDIX family)
MEELFLKNKINGLIPHSSTAISNEEAILFSYNIGALSYPISIVGTSDFNYTFTHKDNRFTIDNRFRNTYNRIVETLSFNSDYHIRCDNLSISEKQIQLETEWTDFASFLTTNKCLNSNEVQNLTSFTPTNLSNELAVVINIIIQDKNKSYLFLTKRSKHLKNFPNCMSTGASGAMGGSTKWTDFDNFGNPSPLLTAQREIFEELGVKVDLKDLCITGLASQERDKQLIFLVEGILKMSKDELISKIQHAEDRDEIEEELYYFIDLDPAQIIPYLLFLEWSPISAVAIWEFLISRFSYEKILQMIEKEQSVNTIK